MSASLKAHAQRRIRSFQEGGAMYEPASTPSSHAAFSKSPMLYYTVYDGHLAPVRKDVVYAHSLEELHYMAIDNASKLDTLDALYRLRPDFSSRTMTLRDLILTSFVGSSDGKLDTMLICAYQGDSPYSLDTTVYAAVMSELVPNTRSTPLRIALNVPSSMKKWSHVSKIRLFGSNMDSKLIELNTRVNRFQVVDLRNDPEGSIRYSARALAEMEAKKSPGLQMQSSEKNRVAPVGETALSSGAESGTAIAGESEGTAAAAQDEQDAQIPSISADEGVEEPATTGSDATQTPELEVSPEQTASEMVRQVADEDEPERDQEAGSDVRPPFSTGSEGKFVDVSSISGPLEAARLEDNTTVETDKMDVEAKEFNPAFKSLEGDQATAITDTDTKADTKTKMAAASETGLHAGSSEHAARSSGPHVTTRTTVFASPADEAEYKPAPSLIRHESST